MEKKEGGVLFTKEEVESTYYYTKEMEKKLSIARAASIVFGVGWIYELISSLGWI